MAARPWRADVLFEEVGHELSQRCAQRVFARRLFCGDTDSLDIDLPIAVAADVLFGVGQQEGDDG